MDYVRLLFGFRGRINRARYLAVQLVLIAFWLTAWFRLSVYLSSQWTDLHLDWVVVITMIWINVATTIKRLHDRNHSGWWAVPVLMLNRLAYAYYGLFLGNYFGVDVSIAGELLLVMLAVALSLLQTWVVIELVFVIGTDGRNRFGPDPLATVATGAAAGPQLGQHNIPAFLVHGAGSSPYARD